MADTLHSSLQIGEEEIPQRPIAHHQSNEEQVSIIRKEFVDLTGNHFSAVILNQLLYWTQRVRDFDLLLEEERSFHPECNVSPRHGWIYKTATDLNEETMLGISHPTMRKYLKQLIAQRWIDERSHPIDKWNKTTQYRVNLRKLQEDLMAIGRNLPDIYLKSFTSSLVKEAFLHKLPETLDKETSNVRILHSNENESTLSSSNEEISNVRNLHSDEKNFDSNEENFHSDVKNLHSYTYTENTSENKNKEHTQDARAREGFDENFFNEVLGAWKKYIGQEVHLTEERKRQLTSLLAIHFQNNLSQWEQFCKRVKTSPFLMGEGARKWRVTLDWVLSESNLLKILEGNFDNPEILEQKKEEEAQKAREKEIQETLASIEDPIWKKWCTQLICPPPLNAYGLRRNPISLFDLNCIANAWFDECEGRLVWIASEDERVLDRIQSLQFNILHVIEREYPKATCIRTHIKVRPQPVKANCQAETFFPPAETLDQETSFFSSDATHTGCAISNLAFQSKTGTLPSFHTSSNRGEQFHE